MGREASFEWTRGRCTNYLYHDLCAEDRRGGQGSGENTAGCSMVWGRRKGGDKVEDWV